VHRQWSPRALSLVAAGACILFGLAGCSSAADTSGKEGGEGADPALLEATDWRATEIAGAPAIADAEAPDVTAVFAAGTMSGSGGVNRYTAEYEVGEDGAITISRPAATLMAGPPDLMEREAAYFEALVKVATFSVTEDSLVLLDDQGTELVRFAAVTPVPLEETTWKALAYNNGKGALESLAAGSEITAVFGADGKLSGEATINRYSTAYEASGETMTIDAAIATTKMAGPKKLMRQEAAYLAALPKTATFAIEGDELWLRDADGAAQAHFVAAE